MSAPTYPATWRARIEHEMQRQREHGKTVAPEREPKTAADWEALYALESNALYASWWVLTGKLISSAERRRPYERLAEAGWERKS